LEALIAFTLNWKLLFSLNLGFVIYHILHFGEE
jgi:hypothetical protein